VSIGVASLAPGGGGEGTDLYRAADRAMYQAKTDGRNRVRIDLGTA
jgi:two-component system chemotaxis family response regulator WspR